MWGFIFRLILNLKSAPSTYSHKKGKDKRLGESVMTIKKLWRKFKNELLLTNGALLLMACGSKSARTDDDNLIDQNLALLLAGKNLSSDTDQISNRSTDTQNKSYQEENDPYWSKSLEMDNFNIVSQYFQTQPKKIYYSFPRQKPSYVEKIADGREWQSVTTAVKTATRDVLNEISDIIDIEFIHTEDSAQPFVIAVMANNQGSSVAYSYFPSLVFSEGSDIFLDNDYLSPEFIAHNKTNYDYEIIVHEIGHALGLKHPFAPLGNNDYVLPQFEDNSRLTAMTYTENASFFNGELRAFDYLTLVGIYGINPRYNNDDNTYDFSATETAFIIDAGGQDLIDASAHNEDVFLDLRENGHSYVGVKHQYISAALQLTISDNSIIENAKTGGGNDWVIGNNSNNHIITADGNDQIYAGEGRDIVEPGIGLNQVNLFELVSENDFVVFDSEISEQHTDVYNFEVGGICDVLVFDCDIKQSANLSPVSKFTNNNVNFNTYDIHRFIDFDATRAAEVVLSGANSDKLFVTDINNGSDLDTEIYFYDISLKEQGELFHIATINSYGVSMSDWSDSNFLFI